MSIDVVETHDVLQYEHEWHHEPSEAHKERVLRDPPKDAYNDSVAVM